MYTCTKIYRHIQRCRDIYNGTAKSAQKCLEMYKDVPTFSKMSRNVQRCADISKYVHTYKNVQTYISKDVGGAQQKVLKDV
jgi:hypothetical protein